MNERPDSEQAKITVNGRDVGVLDFTHAKKSDPIIVGDSLPSGNGAMRTEKSPAPFKELGSEGPDFDQSPPGRGSPIAQIGHALTHNLRLARRMWPIDSG